MRVVLDTNVLMSAFGTRGLCEVVYEVCLADHDLITSDHILKEMQKHLVGKFKMTQPRVREVVALVREQAKVVKPASISKTVCRDVDDLPVLGTLLAGEADCLVTGDRDLLDLDSFEGKPILSPRAFYDTLIK